MIKKIAGRQREVMYRSPNFSPELINLPSQFFLPHFWCFAGDFTSFCVHILFLLFLCFCFQTFFLPPFLCSRFAFAVFFMFCFLFICLRTLFLPFFVLMYYSQCN